MLCFWPNLVFDALKRTMTRVAQRADWLYGQNRDVLLMVAEDRPRLILKYDRSESYCSGLALELCDSIQDSSLSWIGALASLLQSSLYIL